MFGWIVHLYANDPADMNVRLKLPPGAIDPEFQLLSLAVEVCAVLSLFIHLMVVPTDTVTGFGEKAVVVSVEAPGTIDTCVPVVFPDDGAVVDEPQATTDTEATRARIKRTDIKLRTSG
jgi:hypothetical protein